MSLYEEIETHTHTGKEPPCGDGGRRNTSGYQKLEETRKNSRSFGESMTLPTP